MVMAKATGRDQLSLFGSPNPFNSQTTIIFTLQDKSHVIVEVYDLLGRSVDTLIDSDLNAGNHNLAWDAQDPFIRDVLL